MGIKERERSVQDYKRVGKMASIKKVSGKYKGSKGTCEK